MIRKTTLLTLIMLLSATFTLAVDGDEILGKWVTDGGKSHVEISKVKGKYFGKIVCLKEPNYPPEDEEAGKPKHDFSLPINKDVMYNNERSSSVYDCIYFWKSLYGKVLYKWDS